MPGGGALFGNSSSRSVSKNLVEFKAGKMTMKGKMVHPDLRKGLLFVYQSEDSLMHFCWKDRQSGTVEDDLIIFPDDCEFKRVSQCTTGRVYVLKFKSSSRKFFFWVQEPRTDKDDENCRRINDVLNNPPTPGTQRSAGGTPDGDLHNLLTNMSQQQLMQLFGGVGQIGGLSSLLGTMNRPSTGSSRSASTPPTNASQSSGTGTGSGTGGSNNTGANSDVAYAEATSTTTNNSSNKSSNSRSTPTTTSGSGSTTTTTTNPPTIQLSDLQNFLSGLNVPVGETPRNVDLSAALTSENLESLLGDASLVRELQQHLPSVSQSGTAPPPASEQLRATLGSSQFQQALSMFSAALQSGQLGPVVQQFEVGQEAVNAAQAGNMEEFVKALQKASIDSKDSEKSDKSSPSKKNESANSKKKDDDDDEGMSVD